MAWYVWIFVLLSLMSTAFATYDYSVTAFTLTGTPVAYRGAAASTISFSITVNSGASAIVAGTDNFVVTYCFDDVDIRASGVVSLCATETALTSNVNSGTAMVANADYTFTGTSAVTPTETCTSITHLCVYVKATAFTDTDLTNNVMCTNVADRMSCDTDISPALADLPSYITVDTAVTDTISVTVTNAGTAGQGGDITAVTSSYSNYKFTMCYSSAATYTKVAGTTEFTPTFAASDLRQGVAGGSATFTIIGSAAFPAIPAAACDTITHVCIKVDADVLNGASFKLDTIQDDCQAIEVVCYPNPVPKSITMNTATIASGAPVTVNFDVDVDNDGTDTNDVIPAATGSDTNFALRVMVSDQDLSTGASDNLGIAAVIPASYPGSAQTAAMTASQSGNTWSGVTAEITIPHADCPNVVWFCVVLYQGSATSYTDASTVANPGDLTPNTTCDDISAILDCQYDYDVTALTEVNGPVAFRKNVAQTISYSITVQSSTGFPTGTNNFVVKYCFEDKDLGGVGAAGVNLCAAPAALTTDVSATAALVAGVDYTISGSESVTIPNTADCTSITHFCVEVLPTAFTDPTQEKNYKCFSIADRVSCDVDLTPSALGGTPSYVVIGRSSTETVSVTITNSGTAGQGGDIAAVSTPYSNYKFTMCYSSAATYTQVAGTTEFTPTFSASELRQGLAGGSATLTFTGPATFTAIPASACQTITHICIKVEPDTVQHASFKLTTVNDDCVLAEIICYPDPEPKGMSVTTATITSSSTPSTVTFDVDVDNANGGTNDVILAATGSDTNFRLVVKYSDQDLSTGAADGLGLSTVAPATFPANKLTMAITSGQTGNTWTGITAQMTLTDTVCPNMVYFCAILYQGSATSYVDATTVADAVDLSPNTTCEDISAKKICRADVDMTAFTDTGSYPTVFTTSATPFSFSITLRSNVDIAAGATAGTNQNFKMEYRLADADLRATDGVDTLNIAAATLSTNVLDNSALAANTDMTITGTESITIPTATCKDITHLCARSSPNSAYTESNTPNNWRCIEITGTVSCDVVLSTATLTAVTTTFVLDQAVTGNGISVELQNTATTSQQGSDIAAVATTYKNYKFTMQFSSTSSLLGVGSPWTPTITEPLWQGLAAASSETLTFTGTADFPAISSADCESITHVCITIAPDTLNGASFSATANSDCLAVTVTCSPALEIASFSTTAGFPATSGPSSSDITFTVNVDNTATAAASGNNDVAAVTAPETNIAIFFRYSDADLAGDGTDSLGLANVEAFSYTAGHELLGIAAGASQAYTAVQAKLTLPDSDCANVAFVCATIYRGATTNYVDASTRVNPADVAANMSCIASDKVCRADVDITALSETSTWPTIFRAGVATTFNFKATFRSDVDIAAATGNFEVKYRLADRDLRATDGSDGLSITAAAATTDVNADGALFGGVDLQVTGSASITVPAAGSGCDGVLFLCIQTLAAGTGYTESSTPNNYRCLDITDQISCDATVTPSALGGVPDTADPISAGQIKSGQFVQVTVTNGAAASQQGSDIAAVTGSRSNYKFTMTYSTGDPPGAVGTEFYPTFNSAELKQGLAGGSATLTFSGSVDYPAISATDCQGITHVCILAEPDTVNGASFLIASVESTCTAIEVYCYPDPKPNNLVFNSGQTTPIVSDPAVQTISVDLIIENDNNGANDVIAAATGADTNFALQLVLSDVDLGTGSAAALTLNYVTPASYPAGVRTAGLIAGGTNPWAGVTANILLTDTDCASVNYLCAILYKASATGWKDASAVANAADVASNTTCLDISGASEKTCRNDVDMTAFTETTNPVAFRGGVATSFSYTMTLRSATDIAATAGNFNIQYRFADADLRVSSGTDTLSLAAAALTTSIASNAGLAASTDMIGTGTASLTLPMAQCTTITHLCAYSSSSGYTELNTANNYQCIDITDRISCDTALDLTTATDVPDATAPLAGPSGATGLALSLTIDNTATASAQGSDINAVSSPYSNYMFSAQYYDSTTTTLKGSVFYPTFAAADLRQGLAGGAGVTLTLTGTIDYPALSATDCQTVDQVRFTVDADTTEGASFSLAAAATLDQNIEITCYPNPEPSLTAITAGSPALPMNAGSSATLTFTMDVNNPNTGANDVIAAATGTDTNFVLKAVFTDADLSTGAPDTLGLSEVFAASYPGSVQTDALASGDTNTWTGVTANMVMDESACPYINYFCVILLKGSTTSYIDATAAASPSNLAPNTSCIAITATEKVCTIDVSMEAFTDPSNTVFSPGVAATMPFSITLKNNDPATDIAAVSATDKNFDISFKLSDVDLRAAAAASNTLDGVAAITTGITLVPSAVDESQLPALSSLTFTGSVSVTITTGDCADVLYICANSAPSGAAYTETTTKTLNNWYCMDIRDRVSCNVDIAITGLTPNPAGATAPFIGYFGLSTQTGTIALNNAGTTDIVAVSSPNKNYRFILMYSSDGACTLVGSDFYMTLSDSDLRLALAASATINLVGTYDLPALSSTDCPNAAQFCVKVEADSTNGATFAELAADLANNCYCQAITMTCAPDPAPNNLVLQTGTFTGGQFNAIEVSLDVDNSGDDIPAVSGTRTHFSVKLKLSDVDIGGGNADTLGLSETLVSFPLTSELQAAVANSGTAALGGAGNRGTASVQMSDAQCSNVQFLCAYLYPGSDPVYLDSSALTDPNNFTPNVTCTDVSASVSCPIDVDIIGLTLSQPTVYNVAAVGLVAQVTIENTHPSQDITAVTTTNENFHMEVYLSSADVRALGTAANTIATAATDVALDSNSQAGLVAGQSFTFTISESVTISSADCPNLKYICVKTLTKNTAGFTERTGGSYDLNNWRCVDISSQVFCGVDVEVVSVSSSPTAMYGLAAAGSVTVGLNVRNAGDGANTYNNIGAVTGSDYNFAIRAQYSDNDWPSGTADTLGLSPFYPTVANSDLQQALTGVGAAGATTAIFGVFDFPAIPAASCNDVVYVCYTMVAGSGASYAEATADLTNNDFCEAIDVSCYPDPKPTTLVTPTTFTSGSVSTTFSIAITNDGSGSNDIIATSLAPVTNFRITLQPSDVDMASATDTLGITAVDATIPVSAGADLYAALGATGTINLAAGETGTATVYIPQDKCSQVTQLCATLYRGTTTAYVDASSAGSPTNRQPNITCTAITPTCAVDVDMTALSFSATPIPAGSAVTITYSLTLTNLDTLLDIAAATGTAENFQISIDISDADERASGTAANTLTPLTPTVNYDTASISAAGLTASGALTITGDFSITVSTGVCPTVQYLCAESTPATPTGTAYTEHDMANNRRCVDITAQLSCGVDMELVDWTTAPTAADPVIGNDGATISFAVEIRNKATSAADDINAVTGTDRNFKITAGYGSGAGCASWTLVGSTITPSGMAPADLRQGLSAVGTTGATTTISGTLALPVISGTDCTNAVCICAKVEADTTASFIDSVTSNNEVCKSLEITCAPDPAPDSLAVNPTPAQPFIAGQTNGITFQFNINNGNTGTNDVIKAASAPNENYNFQLQLSDVDMNTAADTLGLTRVTPSIAAVDKRQALAASATINLAASYGGSANIDVPQADCDSIAYLCIIFTPAAGALYQDASLVADPSDEKSNTNCEDITAKKICGEDVDVFSLTESANAPMAGGTAVTLSFSIGLRNNVVARDIPVVTGANKNFAITARLSDVDMRATGTASDTLAFTPVATTMVPATSEQQGLVAGTTLSMTGTVTVTPSGTAADCEKTRYFCINSSPSGTAYTEASTTTDNNWHCKDIQGQIQCGVDVVLSAWTGVPATLKSTAGATEVLDVDIENSGTVTVDNIPAVTGADRNFKLTAFYSNADVPSEAAIGSTFTPVGDVIDLQMNLDAQAGTSRIDGTITYPAIPAADCANVNFVCITVDADSTNNAAYTESGTLADNTVCNAVTVSCFPDPKPANLDLAPTITTPKFTTDTTNTITFDLDINNGASGTHDDIAAVTDPDYNFDVYFQLTDVDLATGAADSLGQSYISTTIAAADRRAAAAAGTTVAISSATADVFLPDAICAQVTYLCAILLKGTGALYEDASAYADRNDMASNTTCVDISTEKLCHIDVEMTSLSEPANDPILIGQTTTLTFSLNVRNNDATENIALVTTAGESNFDISFVISEADIRNTGTASNSLSFTAPTTTVIPASDTQSGLVAGGSLTIGGTVDVVIPNTAADCVKARFLCANTSPNGATAYTEMTSATLNNYYCKNIEAQMSCGIDVETTAFTTFPTATTALVGPLGRSGESFSVSIRNIATAGAGNDIAAATGSNENYLIEVYYSTAAAAGAVGSKFYPTVATSEKQVALVGVGASGAVTTLTGTIDYPTVTSCNTVTVLCVNVIPGTGAIWAEAAGTLANNEHCETLTGAISCEPDPKPISLSVSAGTLQAGLTNTITFDVTIDNQNAGTNDDILAEVYPDTNYQFRMQLSDVDMATGTDTLGLSYVIPNIPVADLRAGLTDGGSHAMTGLTADILTPETSCRNVAFLCALLYPGVNPNYLDASATADPIDLANNLTCVAVTPECHQDVEVVQLLEPNNTPLPINVQTTLDFTVDIRNNEAIREIPLQTTAGTENYHLKFYLSNADMRVSGTSSNTLGITAFEDPDVVVSPAADVQAGLLAGQTITLTGTVDVTVPNVAATCAAIRFLCVESLPKTTEYTEDPTQTTNNIGCKDISLQISCNIDVEIVSWLIQPDSTDPMIGVFGRTGVALSAELRNAATAGAGNNIAAVSSPNKNFAFSAYYCDGTTTACSKVGVDFTTPPALADAELQQGLTAVGTAGATTTFTGTIDYPVLTLATSSCNAVQGVCLKVEADTVGGAIYSEASGTLTNNINCQAISLTCSANPRPDSLATTTNVNGGALNTITFTMDIVNDGTTGFSTTNDIFAAINPATNFLIMMKFSDVDMNTASDTLGLSMAEASVDPSELRGAIAAGATLNIGAITATVDLTLPQADCQSVSYLCAIIYLGTAADYIDSSAYSNPNDLKPNTTCFDILALKSCDADASITTFAVTKTSDPQPLQLVVDEWLKVDVAFDIENIATGTRSDIAAVTAPNKNFDLNFLLTNTDLQHGPSTINSTAFTFVSTGANDYDGVAQGATLSFTGTMLTVFKSAICNDLKYACVYFKHQNYNDANHRNNLKCAYLGDIKTCHPDVKIDAFTPAGSQTLIDSGTNTYTFDVTISNVADAINGNDIPAPPTSPAASHNYLFQMQLTDVDLGAGGTDTIGRARDDVTTQYDDVLVAQDAPVSKTGVTVSFSIAAPTTPVSADDECTRIKYACLWVNYGDNARYVDPVLTNNVVCSEIHNANVKNCRPVLNNLDATTTMNAENATVGTVMDLYTVNATQGDNDVPAAIVYTKTSGDGRFSIDSASGVVTVTVSTLFDYETLNTYEVVIEATDTTGNAAYTATGTLTINIIDSNDQPTITNVPVAVAADTPTIKEINPTSVYQVLYTDEDLPAQVMTWSIEISPTTPPLAPFWIDNNGVISVSSPGLNFELIDPPTYSVTVHLTDGGFLPAQTAAPQELIVVMEDVDEELTIHNLPATVYVNENDTSTLAQTIFSVNATDPDALPATLTYVMSVSPWDGNFEQETGNEHNIQLIANPKLNYEKAWEYKIAIMVKDGTTTPKIGILTVKVVNNTVNESPTIDDTVWPTTSSLVLPETQQKKALIFTMKATDEDGRRMEYSISGASPVSGNGKFIIDSSTGELYVAENPGFDGDTISSYTLNMTACAMGLNVNCTYKDLVVNIGLENEPPYFTPASLVVYIYEGSNLPTIPTVATDPDAGQTLTYTIVSSRYSNFFGIGATSGTIIKATTKVFNYEASTQAHIIEATFKVTDDGTPEPLSGYFHLTVHVMNRADHYPSFNPLTFDITVSEDAQPDDSITSFTCTDWDLGNFADPNVTVPILAGGNNDSDLYFKTFKQLGGNVNERYFDLRVQSAIDIETIPNNPFTFLMVCEDLAGLKNTATVTVTVTNVNDNRPTFDPSFYNWEAMYNDTVGTYVGTVTATDGDVEYNAVQYELVESGTSSFTLGLNSGNLKTFVQPLLQNDKYLLYAVAKDTHPNNVDVSVVTTIRVDTYTDWMHLTNWTTGQPVSYFTQANEAAFMSAVSQLCLPCKAKVWKYVDIGGNARAILYFLKDRSTYSVSNIGEPKEFILATDIVNAYTSDKVQTPGNSVTGSAALATYGISTITIYKPSPYTWNWFLDTVEGAMFIGFCMSCVFAMAMTAVFCLFKRFGTTASNQMKDMALASSSKSWAPAPKANNVKPKRTVTPPTKLQDVSRPGTTTSVSNVFLEQDETAPSRGPFKSHNQAPHDYGEEANGRRLNTFTPVAAGDEYTGLW